MHMQFADYLVQHLEHHAARVVFGGATFSGCGGSPFGAALINIRTFSPGKVLWPPVLWALVFIAINLYQITRIYLERRSVVLSEDERKLYDLGFRSLRQREFVALALVGEWKSRRPGEEGGDRRGVGIRPLHLDHRERRSPQAERSNRDVGPGHIIGTALALAGAPSRGGNSLHRARNAHALVAPEPAQLHGQAAGSARDAGRVSSNRDLAGKLEKVLSA